MLTTLFICDWGENYLGSEDHKSTVVLIIITGQHNNSGFIVKGI
jgi:hypothetical protein